MTNKKTCRQARQSERIWHCFTGIIMGAADIVPGVSGGTMAWIMGIYPRLITAIDGVRNLLTRQGLQSPLGALKKLDWSLLAPLALGMILGIGLMVKLVDLPYWLETHPEPIRGLFFGLILASVFVLLRTQQRSWRGVCWLVLGVSLGLIAVNLMPQAWQPHPLMLFMSGFCAISAMLLPGISGALILLILGQYVVILEALQTLDFAVLLPFIAGCACGALSLARILSWAFSRYETAMIWLISGLLIGTLWRVWPFQSPEKIIINGKEKLIGSMPYFPEFMVENLLPVITMFAGALIVSGIETIKNPACKLTGGV